MRLLRNTLTLLAVLGLMAGTATAQDSGVMIEVHGGIALPTSDAAVDGVGPVVGAGIWYSPVDQRWALGTEADFGFQSDGKIYHFVGKAAYIVYTSQDGRFDIMLNAGAGVMILNDLGVQPSPAARQLILVRVLRALRSPRTRRVS